MPVLLPIQQWFQGSIGVVEGFSSLRVQRGAGRIWGRFRADPDHGADGHVDVLVEADSHSGQQSSPQAARFVNVYDLQRVIECAGDDLAPDRQATTPTPPGADDAYRLCSMLRHVVDGIEAVRDAEGDSLHDTSDQMASPVPVPDTQKSTAGSRVVEGRAFPKKIWVEQQSIAAWWYLRRHRIELRVAQRHLCPRATEAGLSEPIESCRARHG